MKYPDLPPGLDPVQAGRFGLWLLGKRSHARALKRSVTASGVPGAGLAQRALSLIAPWRIAEYPGYLRILASICGVSTKTAEEWLYRDLVLPEKHARTLLALSETRERQFAELSAALRVHISERRRLPPKGIIRYQAEARDRVDV